MRRICTEEEETILREALPEWVTRQDRRDGTQNAGVIKGWALL